jgi:hypothetical protein
MGIKFINSKNNIRPSPLIKSVSHKTDLGLTTSKNIKKIKLSFKSKNILKILG